LTNLTILNWSQGIYNHRSLGPQVLAKEERSKADVDLVGVVTSSV